VAAWALRGALAFAARTDAAASELSRASSAIAAAAVGARRAALRVLGLRFGVEAALRSGRTEEGVRLSLEALAAAEGMDHAWHQAALLARLAAADGKPETSARLARVLAPCLQRLPSPRERGLLRSHWGVPEGARGGDPRA
jgi:hypothetical protein